MAQKKLRIKVQTCTFCPVEKDHVIIESEQVIDYNSRREREWLGKHTLWALNHDRSVTTIPVKG